VAGRISCPGGLSGKTIASPGSKPRSPTSCPPSPCRRSPESICCGRRRRRVLGGYTLRAGAELRADRRSAHPARCGSLLFVLGLLLIVSNRWMLVKTITAFTWAQHHTRDCHSRYRAHRCRPQRRIALSILFSVRRSCAPGGRVELHHCHRGSVFLFVCFTDSASRAGSHDGLPKPRSRLPSPLQRGVEMGK